MYKELNKQLGLISEICLLILSLCYLGLFIYTFYLDPIGTMKRSAGTTIFSCQFFSRFNFSLLIGFSFLVATISLISLFIRKWYLNTVSCIFSINIVFFSFWDMFNRYLYSFEGVLLLISFLVIFILSLFILIFDLFQAEGKPKIYVSSNKIMVLFYLKFIVIILGFALSTPAMLLIGKYTYFNFDCFINPLYNNLFLNWSLLFILLVSFGLFIYGVKLQNDYYVIKNSGVKKENTVTFSWRGNDYSFGEALYKLRSSNHYTQSDLSSMLGVSPKAVSKWENGKAYPSTKTMLKMSEIYKIDVAELMRQKERQVDKDKENLD